MIQNFFLFLFYILLFSCTDSKTINDEYYDEYKSIKTVTPGEYCAPSCVWSSWAVTHGAQDAEYACGSGYCACVVNGNIWQSCTLENVVNNIWNENTQYFYNEYKGRLLADKAYSIAYNRNTVGRCYAAVADAIDSTIAVFLYGQHAYEAANQLGNSRWFYEIYDYNLNNLPPGAVVVWAKGNSRSGHISVSLGAGREASDHIAPQMINHYGGGKERVFLPK